MRSVYTGLFYASLPLVMARLLWRSRRNAAYRERWSERLALYSGQTEPVDVWIHAVSVGEAEAAFALIAAIRREIPASILVTTTTPTGSARVRSVLGDRVAHVYLPYDLPDVADRFLRHFSPRLAVFMETEIWPNLFGACANRSIPLLVANARLSERSARRYRVLQGTVREALACAEIAAQTEDDRRRFISVGADPASVCVTGNLKFDSELSASTRAAGENLRRRLFPEGPVWLAASTHPGEERAVLEAFAVLRCRYPDLRLVIAPRHPERFDEVAGLVSSKAYRLARQTRIGEAESGGFEVFLLDTLGDLMQFYVASDIAFVGGSLANVGGHNVLEPALAETAIVFGPHTHNFRQICEELELEKAALRVADAEGLAGETGRLLADRQARAGMVSRARAFVGRNRGAAERHWQLIAPHLAASSASH
ncbi:MAG: lipid IV(A) 3-deoxy-D-manno-octulosonic acid transferase [Methylococcus sp.]|nr:lipid IV(A) 3-deoxy-D-manno-octulosonic acid transferase [Methylococcus sp.]